MKLTKHDTQCVKKKHQLALWNEAICDAFTDLKCEQIDSDWTLDNGFHASLESCSMDSVQLSKVTSDAPLVNRTIPQIKQADSEVVLLHLQVTGSTKNYQGDNRVILQPGDFTLCKSSSPYTVEIDHYHEMIVAKIPVEKLQLYANIDELPTAQKFNRNNQFNKLIENHLLQIWSARAEHMPEQQIRTSEEVTLCLLGSAIDIANTPTMMSRRQRGHLYVIEKYIEDNAHRSDLCIEEIANAAGVTKRYIAQLFKLEKTTCSKKILSERLKLAARRLRLRSYNSDKIIEIAFACGFNSIENFNRTFKAQFGLKPTEYREKYCLPESDFTQP